MTADMIINFFKNYGWVMTALAASGIVLVGILKSIGLFSKLNPNAKKYVYFACSCIVSIIACTVYLCVTNAFDWADWGMISVCVIGFTISIYGVYENTGIRTFLKKIIFSPMKNLIKRIPEALMSKSLTEEKILSLAKSLGKDILLQLASENQQVAVADVPIIDSIDAYDNKSQNVDPIPHISTVKNGDVNNTFADRNFFS